MSLLSDDPKLKELFALRVAIDLYEPSTLEELLDPKKYKREVERWNRLVSEYTKKVKELTENDTARTE